MKQTILTFGDSNTHGTAPMVSRDNLPRLLQRWPVVVADLLDCVLIEDGLPGRTACPLNATSPELHRDGHLGLRMALHTHRPIDRLIIMLGTNDLKTHYGTTAAQIAAGIAGLLVMAHDQDIQAMHGGFKVTIICPPPVEEVGSFVPEFLGGAEKSRQMLPLFQEVAGAWDAEFIDAGAHIAVDPTDGIHLSAEAHVTLGRAVAAALA